jgi:hypothetical protein
MDPFVARRGRSDRVAAPQRFDEDGPVVIVEPPQKSRSRAGDASPRKLEKFSPIAREFFLVLRDHIAYRLIRVRGISFFETLAMFCDPVTAKLAPVVFDGDDDEFNYSKIRNIMIGAMENFAPGAEELDVEPARPDDDDGISITQTIQSRASVDFYESFTNSPAPVTSISGKARFGLKSAIALLAEYDPLDFWTPSNRRAQPKVFHAAIRTLSYSPTSVFQETVFSTCGRVFTPHRSRLALSPGLSEDLLLLTHSSKRERRLSKEQQSKKRKTEAEAKSAKAPKLE